MPARLAKASAAFGRLQENVWYRRGITRRTKIKVYKDVVLTTLLYGCETWTVYKRHARKLNHFHTTSLRRLLGIVWQDKIPDTEVLARAHLPSIHTILMQAYLGWAGHVVYMPDHKAKNLFCANALANWTEIKIRIRSVMIVINPACQFLFFQKWTLWWHCGIRTKHGCRRTLEHRSAWTKHLLPKCLSRGSLIR